MNFRTCPRSAAFATALCSLALGTSGCRKRNGETRENAGPPPVVASELLSNGLGSLPGAVYRSQAGSPIHWQPWTKESMARTKTANRLVFGVIAMPQQPGFQGILKSLENDPALVDAINQHYVPMLIDGDASREVGLLSADLCSEIKRSLQLPLFVWMTAEGNPVAWIPVSDSSPGKVSDLFNQSHSMVSRMWSDDSDYVTKNSAQDNDNRRNRLAQRKNAKVMSAQPAEDAVRGLRQLASLYDPYSHSFDEAGGLFPAGAIELLATSAVLPGLSAETRSRCLETTRDMLKDLLPSAMFDPLEGGVFSSRRGNSWALPSFIRDCGSQARAAVALIHAYRATGDTLALQRALGLIDFAEKSYTTTEGLFSVGMMNESAPTAWLWSVEEIRKELLPEDAAWWIKATGMKGLGNLPSEVDPQREYFRCNSLGISQSIVEIAAEQSQAPEVFTARFETVRKTLLKTRNARLGPALRDDCSHAATTFRMVSAYAAAFGATGDEKFREKAVALLGRARVAFSEGPKLRAFSKEAPASIGAGRAFLYGVALQAALDLSVITSEEKWLIWSEDLATTAAELFTDSHFLKECTDEAKIMDVPVTDLVMLFDDSTAGLISLAECRLAERKRPLVASFSELAIPLPTHAVDQPILHTDLLQATFARHFRVTLVTGSGISSEMKLATERLSMRMFQRRAAVSADEVPAGSVLVILANGETRLVSTPDALQQAVLPSGGKS
ncbi:MAG: hypothetical protein RLZZ398_802 [Verrucomicrobiota bacterium]